MKDYLGSIAGQITIEGKHAPNLDLALLPQRHHFREDAIATTKTDEAGRYRFLSVPTGHYWLKVLESRYVNAIHWDAEGAGRRVWVADDESIENADLDLILGGAVTGRITDANGSPVADEYVALVFENEDRWHCEDALGLYDSADEFRTDENGEYRLYGIP